MLVRRFTSNTCLPVSLWLLATMLCIPIAGAQDLPDTAADLSIPASALDITSLGQPSAPPRDTAQAQTLRELSEVILTLERLLTPTLAREDLDSKKGRKRFEKAAVALRGPAGEPRDPFSVADSTYHVLMDRLFGQVAGDTVQGIRLAAIAESSLLEDLVIPVNRIFGQKKRMFNFGGYAMAARSRFAVHAADTDDPGPAIYYVTVGSHNQDRRSMFLDGEATALVAGEDALIAALDFAFLIGVTDWVDSVEELEERYPSKKSLIRRFSQWLRDLI
jgi:hypothetical protein